MSESIRVATFNIGLDSARQQGELAQLLEDGDYPQAQKSAQIIQKVRPDILLINEIDGNDAKKALTLYRQKFLQVGQGKQQAIQYPYHYMPDCNTGVDAGIHFRQEDKDASKATDKYGFGYYDGQYCMAVLSMYPIDLDQIHTFQKFLWKDLPGAKLPALNGKAWYSESGLKQFRLSSKTHADVPVTVQGKALHLLISHPTPPVFDGEEDRNGLRNHDEIKFWQHYINGATANGKKGWLKNDTGNAVSGLTEQQRFLIMGDLNASTLDGDATEFDGERAITALLHDVRVKPGFSEKADSTNIPSSFGGKENLSDNPFSQFHTAGWRMRADYVIPSAFGLAVKGSGVFWPKKDSPDGLLVNDSDGNPASSDHRLVWLDLQLTESK